MRNLQPSASSTRSKQDELQPPSSALRNAHIAPVALCLLVVGIVTACSSPTGSPAYAVDPAHADDLLVVDCLLPPRVRQLGSQLTYLEAPRPAKTSAVECEIRGGEYTSWDRANFATSLKIWLPKAKEGDARAQNYVGEIFEKGLGVTPDFQAAFQWYSKAAAQDYSQSQINLGQLYEQGLGVEADVIKAMNWYRKASGLDALQMAYVPSAEAVAELQGLRSELSEQTENVAELREQLDVSSKDLAATRKQREVRQREIAREKKDLARSKKELELANATLRDEQERIEAEAKRQKQASKSFAQQITESSSVDEMVAAGQAQVDWAAEMLSSLYAELTSSETALDGRGSEVAAQTERQTADVERERNELATARTKLARDQSALEAAQRSNAAETKKLERERTALAKNASTSTGANEEREANRVAQERAKAQLAIVRAAHDRRETSLAKQQSDIAAREQQQGKIENERLALAATQDALTQEREQLKQQRRTLEAETQNIKRSRTELAKKSDTTATASQTLKTARAQLNRTQALVALQAAAQKNRLDTLKQREQEIEGREQAFARKSDELGRLDEEIAGLKAEAEQSRTDVVMLAQNNAINFPGPSIQIIDPLIPLTRGLTITMAIPPAATRLLVGRVEAPAGLISLTINDQEVKTDEKGLFRTDITLSDGDTPVALVAIDRDGKRGDRKFMLRASEKVRGATMPKRIRKPQVKFGNYYALVIGNNDYGKLPKLETAIADAKAVGQVLDQRYGFKVTNLVNANRYEILSALNVLRAKLTEDDNLLIYYAGHGELDKVNMRGHWLPVDAEPGSSANWISNIALTDILNTMNARHVMVVADSCYSGALTRSSLARLEAGLTTEARESWQRAMVQKRSRTALTSGGIAPVLDAGGGEHSIFAKAFINTLSANSDVIEGQRLFQELSAQVTWAAEAKNFEQIPQYAPIKFAGHESGEFFFVPEL